MAGVFDARPGAEAALGAVLAHYVVVGRTSPGCRNIDLVASLTTPGRFLVYEKWESADHQRAHLTSTVTEEMAAAALPLLAGPRISGCSSRSAPTTCSRARSSQISARHGCRPR